MFYYMNTKIFLNELQTEQTFILHILTEMYIIKLVVTFFDHDDKF